jgi:hypothetical protein
VDQDEITDVIEETINSYLDQVEDWDQVDTQDLAENIARRLGEKS